MTWSHHPGLVARNDSHLSARGAAAPHDNRASALALASRRPSPPPPPRPPSPRTPSFAHRVDSTIGTSTSGATAETAAAGAPRPLSARTRRWAPPTSTSSSPRRPSGAHPPPADPGAVLGWTVVDAATGQIIGLVAEIVAEEGNDGGVFAQSQPFIFTPSASLRIINTDVDPKYGPGAVETHLIPYAVPDIVRSARVGVGQISTLSIAPPPGLLDLGRRRLLIGYLGPRLRAAAATAAAAAESEAGAGDGGDGRRTRRQGGSGRGTSHQAPSSASSGLLMPTRAQLEAAGEGDLARDVADAGGFASVALAVGLRARRRPVGYWDNPDNLDDELALFVAAQWVELEEDAEEEDEEGGDGASKAPPPAPPRRYFYNVATRRVRWTPPVAPVTVALDDSGSAAIRVEDASSSRAMPPRSAILAAGRYDLHHAVVYAGGYRAVGEALGRPPAWPPSAAHARPGALGRALRAVATARARADADEVDGVATLTAATLPAPAPPRRPLFMPTKADLLDAGRADLVAAVAAAGGFRAAAKAAGLALRRKPRGAAADLAAAAADLRAFMGDATSLPSHEELRAAGRHDLRYALQLHGSAALARAAGAEGRGRGRPRKR